MKSCDEFYQKRDVRTQVYLGGALPQPRPVALGWGPEVANTAAGQVLILSLGNQLARFCRSATFSGADAPLAVPALLGGATLHEALLHECRAIDPCGEWEIGEPQGAAYHIWVGSGNRSADLYLGYDGWIAHTAPTPTTLPVVDTPASKLGAGMAACLATMNAFKVSLDLQQPLFHGTLSLWNFGRNAHAQQGPQLQEIALGDALMVGAGAVAAALTFWLTHLPVTARWDIVDKDIVQLDNTNRGMLFTAADAGWPEASGRNKAKVLAQYLPDAVPHSVWYDEFQTQGKRWDLVLPLANERGVRAAIQATYPPLMIHATTSANWQTQLHRHRPGRDRCIVCRLPENNAPPPACAVGALGPTASGEHRSDAALPFLSAAAGLLVAADLMRLGLPDYAITSGNVITLDWHGDVGRPTVRQESCEAGCPHWGDPAVRKALNSSTRWFPVDNFAI